MREEVSRSFPETCRASVFAAQRFRASRCGWTSPIPAWPICVTAAVTWRISREPKTTGGRPLQIFNVRRETTGMVRSWGPIAEK